MMRSFIRTLTLGAFVALILPATTPASAQAAKWPQKPVRLFVHAVPGGAADATGRLLQVHMSKILGQPILIENKPGGNGMVASGEVARAAPDGYTFTFIDSAHASNAALRKSLPYDSIKDFTPIAFVWRAALAYAVLSDSPIKSLADLVDRARKQPGRIAIATRGPGSASDLASIQLELAAGIDLNLIEYKGAAPALTDVLGGHVPVLASNVALIVERMASGTMRGLAVTTPERSGLVPSVPTVAELGYPGYQASEWLGIVGPANLPKDIVARMSQAIKATLEDPEVATKMEAFGHVTIQSPEDFGKSIKTEIDKMALIIKKSNIKVE